MSFDVPDACTLPTVEQPLRLAEFSDLFATAVRDVESVTAQHVRLRLAGPAGLDAAVRDLTAREAHCCTFFTFTVTPTETDVGEALTLDIVVPDRYADVLDSLAAAASAAVSS
jgi:hypothetical protein